MISDKDIEHLAALARLELAEEEKKVIRRDLAAILAYVAELEQALPETETAVAERSGEYNVLRKDSAGPETPAANSAELLTGHVERGYVVVKRVK